MNQCEMMFEIEITPNRFREIAAELEGLAKSDLFTKGQVIRYKFNHKFAFVYRPEVRSQVRVTDSKETGFSDVIGLNRIHEASSTTPQ